MLLCPGQSRMPQHQIPHDDTLSHNQRKWCRAAQKTKTSETVKTLRHFLGAVNCHCDMWKCRSHILASLTESTGKGAKLQWAPPHQNNEAFEEIKCAMAQETILACPDFDKSFLVTNPLEAEMQVSGQGLPKEVENTHGIDSNTTFGKVYFQSIIRLNAIPVLKKWQFQPIRKLERTPCQLLCGWSNDWPTCGRVCC